MVHSLVLLTAILAGPAGDASTFGKSLALLGDLDGDRCSEIAVGSPSDGEGRRGKVFLFSGKHGGSFRELTGNVENSGFGTDVAGVEDQDGDRVPDLAVGAPFVRGTGSEGRVSILSGKDGKAIRTLVPESGEHYFGTDLVTLGDLDGEHRALHWGHHRVLGAAVAAGSCAIPSAPGELGMRGLGHEGVNLVTPTVELDG